PGVGADLGGEHRGGVVRAGAVDRHGRADGDGGAVRSEERRGGREVGGVGAGDGGRVAQQGLAHHAGGGLRRLGGDGGAGGDGGRGLVLAVVDGGVVEGVAGVRGVPGVGADLGGEHRRRAVGAGAVDRHGRADGDGGAV